MIHRQAKISAEDLKKLAQVETSAQHWAIQAANLELQRKAAISQYEAMTAARNQILEVAYKEAGIDSNTIQDIRISMNQETKEGRIDVMCVPPPEAAPTPEANGAAPQNPAPTS